MTQSMNFKIKDTSIYTYLLKSVHSLIKIPRKYICLDSFGSTVQSSAS